MVTIRDIKTICTAPEGINLLVVKVETSEPGLYGLGCGTFAYRHLAVKLVVEEYLRPLLIGRDVSDINDIWQLMHQNGYWRNGPIENNAISGVDMALWDIKGKMANMPLYQLFGGKCRDGVPVYRHVDGRDLSEICENIAKYREIGVKTIRCQCGGYGGSEYGHTPAGAPVGAKPGVYLDGNAYIRDTVKLFDGIRSKMGDEIGLVHDVHERIAPADAVRLAKELEPYHLTFLEDPVSLEQVEYIRQIKNASSIPIAEGELFNNPYEYRTLITERLIDYIRVHITQVGGITPARKLQIFAEQFGVRTAWHGPGDMSPLAHAANVHIGLVHDVHERIAPADAVRLAKELEPYHLTFLEDPVSLEQVEYIRQIKNASSIPIAEGELFNNPYEYRTLITERLIDYIRVHITQVGGITPARKLQIFAEQFGVRTAWHGPGDMSPLAHAANVHIDLAAPNFGVQEWSGIEPPNFVIQKLKGPHGALLEVFSGLPEYKDGYVYANDKPGLGVDLIEKEAEKYPCENTVTTWTQTRRMDGALQTP